MLNTRLETRSAASRYCATLWIPSANASIEGPIVALSLLIRDEMVVGLTKLVLKVSRMEMSVDERRELSIAGGWACDDDRGLSRGILGFEGGRKRASRDFRSDLSLEILYQS